MAIRLIVLSIALTLHHVACHGDSSNRHQKYLDSDVTEEQVNESSELRKQPSKTDQHPTISSEAGYDEAPIRKGPNKVKQKLNERKARRLKMKMERAEKRKLLNGTESVTRKKKRRRKKGENETVLHYYDHLSREDEGWMKFVDFDYWLEQAELDNQTNIPCTTIKPNYKVKFKPDANNLREKIWRRLNKTRTMSTAKLPYRVWKEQQRRGKQTKRTTQDQRNVEDSRISDQDRRDMQGSGSYETGNKHDDKYSRYFDESQNKQDESHKKSIRTLSSETNKNMRNDESLEEVYGNEARDEVPTKAFQPQASEKNDNKVRRHENIKQKKKKIHSLQNIDIAENEENKKKKLQDFVDKRSSGEREKIVDELSKNRKNVFKNHRTRQKNGEKVAIGKEAEKIRQIKNKEIEHGFKKVDSEVNLQHLDESEEQDRAQTKANQPQVTEIYESKVRRNKEQNIRQTKKERRKKYSFENIDTAENEEYRKKIREMFAGKKENLRDAKTESRAPKIVFNNERITQDNEETNNKKTKTVRDEEETRKMRKKQKSTNIEDEDEKSDSEKTEQATEETDSSRTTRKRIKLKKRRRNKRDVPESYSKYKHSSMSDGSDEHSKSDSETNRKEISLTTRSVDQTKITPTQTSKKKRKRTLSVAEAKKRRLDRKKAKISTPRAAEPEIIANIKEHMKKDLNIPSSELHHHELTVKPNLTTVYSVDGDNIAELLRGINGSNNEKLFFNLIKDLEETGTIKQELQKEIEIEKTKIKAITTMSTSPMTKREIITPETTVKIIPTIVRTTKKPKVQTTFPLYVDGLSDEERLTQTKQTKKILRPNLTTKKKSVHEILGITTEAPGTSEELNSAERKEFFHDYYFDYGKRGPVKKDILVTTTPKPRIKTEIYRKISIDPNEIKNLKKKRNDLDLEYMLGSDADYYDEMKRIMDEKSIGKDTRERMMTEALMWKYGRHILERTNPITAETKTTTVTTLETKTTTTIEKMDFKSPAGDALFNIYIPPIEEVKHIAETKNKVRTPVPEDTTSKTEATVLLYSASNPLFNVHIPELKIKHKKQDSIEDAIDKYNKELLGEENDDDDSKEKKEHTRQDIMKEDSTTMEQRSDFQKILQHYLISASNEDGNNPISMFVRNVSILHSTNKFEQETLMKTTLFEENLTKYSPLKRQKNDASHTTTFHEDGMRTHKTETSTIITSETPTTTTTKATSATRSTKIRSSREFYDEEAKKKLKEDILRNANPGYEEESGLDSGVSHESEADRQFLKELDHIEKMDDEEEDISKTLGKNSKFSEMIPHTANTGTTSRETIVAPVDSKELAELMKNKDAHFEQVLQGYLDKKTSKRTEKLRGRSTKVFSPTLKRSKFEEWEITKSYCPTFLNQTMFDQQCQKFAKIINKRGEDQLRRLDFEMKTKHNNLGKLVSKNILTANNFADVVKRKTKKPYDLTSEILYEITPDRTIEPHVQAKYTNISGNIISKCGYFIDDKYPFLGALPDGLIESEGIVKFVNTSTYPNINLKMLMLRDNYLRKNFIVGKDIALAPEGELSYEIQGELHVAKRQYCDLFVYNGNDHVLLKVERQKDFWKAKMRKPLIDFYRQHMMPVVVKRLLHRRFKLYSGDDHYLLNSDEDLLSVIRGLRGNTKEATIPTRPVHTSLRVHVQTQQEEEDDVEKLEEEEWENLHKMTVKMSVMGRTKTLIKLKTDKKLMESPKQQENFKRKDKKVPDSKQRKIVKRKHQKILDRISESLESQTSKDSRSEHQLSTEESANTEARRRKNFDVEKKIELAKKKNGFSESKSSESNEQNHLSLESLYILQEKRRKARKKLKKTVKESKEVNTKYHSNRNSETYDNQVIRKRKEKLTSISNTEEKSSKSLETKKSRNIHQRQEKAKIRKIDSSESSHRKITSSEISHSSRYSKSSDGYYRAQDVSKKNSKGDQSLSKKRKFSKLAKKKKRPRSSESSESKSVMKKEKKKIVKRDLEKAETSKSHNQIKGKRVKRDNVPTPNSDNRVTIENLYSYKDTEYQPASYDYNESVFGSLKERVAKKKAEPDFLVDFYKKGLIGKEEFLAIVKNKTREGKQWRRIPSVESTKEFDTENYSDLVKAVKGEPLSGIKETASIDSKDYDKDDVCKKYMRNIGYGRPIDDTIFNKSIVFTADDLKQLKEEKIRKKHAKAKKLRMKNKFMKIKGKRSNNSLSIGDLSLGDDDPDIDPMTKKKGKWKTTPKYDPYNKTHRSQRRQNYREQYRAYWENLEKLKKLYPSAEEDPDAKLSDRFYRRLKHEGVKTKTWEYTSIRDCCHSYSTEFKEQRKERKKILQRVYAQENTVELLQRLGKRLARKKQNKTQSEKMIKSSDNLLDIVKEELVKRKSRNLTKIRIVRKRRSIVDASRNPYEYDENEIALTVAAYTDTGSAESDQESEETALRKAEQGIDESIPEDRTTLRFETAEELKNFEKIKKVRAKKLKERPKYAKMSSGSIEFVLLQKELKKNGEDFSYLDVSITGENQHVKQDDIKDISASGFYVTKLTKPPLNDEEALMQILKEKSEENVFEDKKEVSRQDDTNQDQLKMSSNTELPNAQPEETIALLKTNKQTKKRGRPRKQMNTTSIKQTKRNRLEKLNENNTNRLRRKRSVEISKTKVKRRPLKVKQLSKDSSLSSETFSSSESSDVKSKRKIIKNKDRVKTQVPKRAHSSEEPSLSSKNSEEKKLKLRNFRNEERVKVKRKFENSGHACIESSSSNLSNDKKKLKIKKIKSKEVSSEESSSSSNSSDEKKLKKLKSSKNKDRFQSKEAFQDSSHFSKETSSSKIGRDIRKLKIKKLNKKKGKLQEKSEDKKISKKFLKSVSLSSSEIQISKSSCNENVKKKIIKKVKKVPKSSANSIRDSSHETDESKLKESSLGSENHGQSEKPKKKFKTKKEFLAHQRKLRRKKRKLLIKKMKRQNLTMSPRSDRAEITKQSKLQTKIKVNPSVPSVGTTPYTPTTIIIKFTKDPRYYKKRPTRDVESIFDHAENRYEDFIKEYNLKHSCTPLSKRAIQKLQIIKEKEFNQKNQEYEKDNVKREQIRGFESYDSDDFDNSAERKHKPWEKSLEGTQEEEADKKTGKYSKEETSEEIDKKKTQRHLKHKFDDSKTVENSKVKSNKRQEKQQKLQDESQANTIEIKKEKSHIKKTSGQHGKTNKKQKQRKERIIKSAQSRDSKMRESSAHSDSEHNEETRQEIMPTHRTKVLTPHTVSSDIRDTHCKTRKTTQLKHSETPEPTGTTQMSEIYARRTHSDGEDYLTGGESMNDFQALAEQCAHDGEYSIGQRSESASAIKRRIWKEDLEHQRRWQRETRVPKSDSSMSTYDEYDQNQKDEEKKLIEGDNKPNEHTHEASDIHDNALKRQKRTPQVTTQANVVNINPLLIMTEGTPKKKKRTTHFKREVTPWKSEETKSASTMIPLRKRLQKRLNQIQRNTNKYMAYRPNYTSVAEHKRVWHLLLSPNTTYTTAAPLFDREIHFDFTAYRVTDEDIYKVIANKIVRDNKVPNKRKSQFRHSRQFFEMLMSTTPDPALMNMADEMRRYWTQREEIDLFLYRGQRDGRDKPNTVKWYEKMKRMEGGKKWRMLQWKRPTTVKNDEDARTEGDRTQKRNKKKETKTKDSLEKKEK
uniref:Uncharacterized protein n=2 Tax=Cacopsylla melanoneura TaxID=428564 RepID=A0A8D8QUW9_9HEMI